MTIAQRKNTKTNIDSLDRVLNLLNWKKDVFLNESPEKSYDEVVGYVESVMTKLKENVEALPIGHRYTGTFYVKKPYSIPSESVKLKGSAFMSEDLVSWIIDSEDEYAKNLYYVRSIFKDKGMTRLLEREDGDGVFEVKKDG